MKNRLWVLSGCALIGSAVAHAGVRVPVLLADVAVPEPATALVGAGALLVVLGLARRRQSK